MDGVDAALVSFERKEVQILSSITKPYPENLRDNLIRAIRPETRFSLHELASLNIQVGRWFADTVQNLLERTSTPHADIVAIGSHGQTLRHSPETDPPYTIQIGDPATIATRCGITTVADFRSLDVAAGGQGAPLVPPFHETYFRLADKQTVVINIGGIANITVLPANSSMPIEGFDTGPGNCLLDEWICRELERPYDEGGRWAASGHVSKTLLEALMANAYIHRRPPKSTGREQFNLAYLDEVITSLDVQKLTAVDVQATLTAFTVKSIVHGIEQSGMSPDRAFVCGGGTRNDYLMRRISKAMPATIVESTAIIGLDPDMVEAVAFAWLAMQRLLLKPVRLTTSKLERAQILGAVYEPSEKNSSV